jgi:ABC-2 type transport system ATP-binding protein
VDHGRIIALGTPADLKASIPGGYLLRLHLSRSSPEVVERLKALPGVTEVRASGNDVDLYADRGGPLIPGIVSAISDGATELCDVHISEPSLENLFLHHTGRSLRP